MKLYLKRIMRIFTIVFCLVVLTNCTVMAYSVTSNFSGSTNNIGSAVTSAQKILLTVLNVTRIVGLAVAIIMLTVVGIKFMVAAPSERANIKQYTINYVIGACILLGASGILTLVKTFAQNSIKP